jgi:hypothetical protein
MICRICDHPELHSAVDLGQHPWANHFLRPEDIGREPYYPLRVVHCPQCQCAQLDYTVPKETMFSSHTYLSGTTATLRNHFMETARRVDRTFFQGVKDKSILDIGSNDGTQLLQYQALGFQVQGVESCAPIAAMANAQGVPTDAAFFNLATARRWNRKFHLINASGVFFHLEELHSVTDAVRFGLRDDGVFVVQFLYMKSIMENLAFDQIYHEHLLYYTIATIGTLLKRHGLEAFDAYWAPIHGGSIILMAGHAGRRPPTARLEALRAEEARDRTNDLATYQRFAERVRQAKLDTLAYLDRAKARGKRIFGLGAPVKGNTLLNYFGVGTAYIDYLVEKNPLRKGLYSPGMHIPVVLESELPAQPDIYFVLAWNFKKEILANYAPLIAAGLEMYFPVNPKE